MLALNNLGKLTAVINEPLCIGCTLCIDACPVDAIVGAAKQMHTVISEHCIGCELCVAPCPVDCIDMQPALETMDQAMRIEKTSAAQRRFELCNTRRVEEKKEKKKNKKMASENSKHAIIAAALERARKKRALHQRT